MNPRLMALRSWIAVIGWTGSAGCLAPSSPETFQMPVAIEVRDGLDRGVPGAIVRVAKQKAGLSGPHGRLLVLVSGQEGDTTEVSIECPQGYEVSPAREKVVLRRLATSQGSISLVPHSLALRCHAVQRKVVLLVRTTPPVSVPIRAFGREVGRTDEDGVAQVLLEGQAGEEVEVSLDTNAQPRLRPSSPTRRVAFSDRPSLLVFDQTLEASPIKARRGFRLPRRL